MAKNSKSLTFNPQFDWVTAAPTQRIGGFTTVVSGVVGVGRVLYNQRPVAQDHSFRHVMQ